MKDRLKLLVGTFSVLLGTQAVAQITFYEGEGFRGRAFTTDRQHHDFRRSGFNDRASSVVVDHGRWEVCEDSGFRGECVVLRPGSYDSLQRMGVNNRLSSVRQTNDRRQHDSRSPEPLASPNYDYRRRTNERVYEARVDSVRAVMRQSEEHCWIEREQVERGRGASIVGGVIGGVIGGVLGHQIGHGTGNDIATVGGAAAGVAIGANAGRNQRDYSRNVRRCERVPDGRPDYWDVDYSFRNIDHRIQMSEPPGRTIYVNRRGEPRQ
jgi:uncharacterized protein YcfJ